MPAEQEKKVIVDRVRQLLADATAHGVHLQLTGSRFDDDWLYLVVAPTQKDERASQHAHLMTEIERTLLKEGYDQVLLVPAVPEHAGLNDVSDAAN
jgi:hypothetical protein